jgi:hypothetical protein
VWREASGACTGPVRDVTRYRVSWCI